MLNRNKFLGLHITSGSRRTSHSGAAQPRRWAAEAFTACAYSEPEEIKSMRRAYLILWNAGEAEKAYREAVLLGKVSGFIGVGVLQCNIPRVTQLSRLRHASADSKLVQQAVPF